MAGMKSVALVAAGLVAGAVGGGLIVRAMEAGRVAELNAGVEAARRDAETARQEAAAQRRDLEARVQELQAAASAQRGDKAAFAAAISAELARSGRLCVEETNWPVAPNIFDPGHRDRLDALARVGLVRAVQAQADRPGFGLGPRATEIRYELTEAGRAAARPIERGLLSRPGAEALCYGRRALEEVVNWEGPMTMGGYAEARVLYRYRVDHAAPWATDAGLRKAYPALARDFGSDAERQEIIVLKRTANGWSARGLGE
jgi:hypothetical protein